MLGVEYSLLHTESLQNLFDINDYFVRALSLFISSLSPCSLFFFFATHSSRLLVLPPPYHPPSRTSAMSALPVLPVAADSSLGTGGAAEREALTARVTALKAHVRRQDQAIAALLASQPPADEPPAENLIATIKKQLAQLHEVLHAKERAIQELRLKVDASLPLHACNRLVLATHGSVHS